MKNPDRKSGKSHVRVSYPLLALAVVSMLCCYGYRVWATSRREQATRPRLATDALIKALRTYHSQVGSFPKSFQELQERVWRNQPQRNFGNEGRELALANYYYIYWQAGAHTCTVWAIPTGTHREEGATHFLVLTPDTLRRWKGAPLQMEDIERLRGAPAYAQLAVLGLVEQPQLDLKKQQGRLMGLFK
jgi:hypothetical protein